MLEGELLPTEVTRFQPVPQGYPAVPTATCNRVNELVTKIYAAVAVYAYNLGTPLR